MSAPSQLDPLGDTLERFERQLEIPYVPGDLDSWCSDISEYLQEVRSELTRAVRQEHPRSYESIVKNGANLSHEVDKMREADGKLLESLDAVESQAHEFRRRANEEDHAGQQFQPHRDRLVDAALQFILSVRKQRAAISTWSSEALQRMNGTGD
jgi:hypothetical protein